MPILARVPFELYMHIRALSKESFGGHFFRAGCLCNSKPARSLWVIANQLFLVYGVCGWRLSIVCYLQRRCGYVRAPHLWLVEIMFCGCMLELM